MACNTAQCCFCKGYIVNQGRHRMIIDKVDMYGSIYENVNHYPNICDDCMDQIKDAMDKLDDGVDSAKRACLPESINCAFCKSVDLHSRCCNCLCILCEDHAHLTEMTAQFKCPICERNNRYPHVCITTATPTVTEAKKKFHEKHTG